MSMMLAKIGRRELLCPLWDFEELVFRPDSPTVRRAGVRRM